jgi:hypothetical protein
MRVVVVELRNWLGNFKEAKQAASGRDCEVEFIEC